MLCHLPASRSKAACQGPGIWPAQRLSFPNLLPNPLAPPCSTGLPTFCPRSVCPSSRRSSRDFRVNLVPAQLWFGCSASEKSSVGVQPKIQTCSLGLKLHFGSFLPCFHGKELTSLLFYGHIPDTLLPLWNTSSCSGHVWPSVPPKASREATHRKHSLRLPTRETLPGLQIHASLSSLLPTALVWYLKYQRLGGLNNRNSFSPCSRDLEVGDQVVAMAGFSRGLAPRFVDGALPPGPSRGLPSVCVCVLISSP